MTIQRRLKVAQGNKLQNPERREVNGNSSGPFVPYVRKTSKNCHFRDPLFNELWIWLFVLGSALSSGSQAEFIPIKAAPNEKNYLIVTPFMKKSTVHQRWLLQAKTDLRKNVINQNERSCNRISVNIENIRWLWDGLKWLEEERIERKTQGLKYWTCFSFSINERNGAQRWSNPSLFYFDDEFG